MKNNKRMVGGIIISSVTILIVLMGFMFVGIGYFVDDKSTPPPMSDNQIPIQELIVFEANISGVVINKTNLGIRVKNLLNNEEIELLVTDGTVITDKYEKIIPYSSLSLGHIVNLTFEPANQTATAITIDDNSFEKTQVSAANINRNANSITIGTSTYTLNNLHIINHNGIILQDIYELQEYDTLTVRGKDLNVYSIEITNGAGFIELVGFPSTSGRIEIDRQRQLLIENLSIADSIPVSAGSHHIALYIDGYEPLVLDNAQINDGQVYILNSSGLQQIHYTVTVRVNSLSYMMTINNREYKSGEAISLPLGDYILKIVADGYEEHEQTIRVRGNMNLQPTLIPILEEVVPQNTTTNNTQTTIEPEPVVEEPTVVNATIKLDTYPEGAKVFIDGTYAGVTPMSKDLAQGIYKAEFELEGYERYTTSIIIEKEDIRNDYLYMLTPQ